MEIADAAWLIDNEWAKKLLRDAYELTFPDEKERERLRQECIGAKPLPPTEVERARTNLRNRVFAVADQAVKQLGRAPVAAELALSLGALANALAPVNEGLAFDVLDEAVAAANAGKLEESELCHLSIEPEVFKTLAAKDDVRARQAAQGLKVPAARITALAATYQREVKSPAKENVPRLKS